MASYLVMTPSDGASNPDSARFIRDGFSFWAFLFPLVWMLSHRMWLYALALLLLEAFLAALGEDLGASGALVLVQLAISLLIALESGAIRQAHLRSRGYTLVAAFSAENLDQAEEIYFSSVRWPASSPLPAPDFASAPVPPGGPVLGLFDYGKGY